MIRPFNDEAIASTHISVPNASQELKPATPSAAIGDTNSGSLAESGLVNEAEEGKSEKVNEGGDQSVPISSWYSSWGWYSTMNTSGPVQHESGSLEVKTISEDLQIDVPLFVSRLEPISSETREGDAPSMSASAHPSPYRNPITTSMEANWGDWASFFSSNSLMVKTLGYGGCPRVRDVKRDGDGMEVMDLDDEDERGESTLLVGAAGCCPAYEGDGLALVWRQALSRRCARCFWISSKGVPWS